MVDLVGAFWINGKLRKKNNCTETFMNNAINNLNFSFRTLKLLPLYYKKTQIDLRKLIINFEINIWTIFYYVVTYRVLIKFTK